MLPAKASAQELPDDRAIRLPTVRVEFPADCETATGPVQGFVAPRSAAETETDTPLIETQQSISVITRDQMDQRDVQTINEALSYTADVQTGNFGFDPRFDSFAIRGFSANVERYTDYLYGLRQPASGWLAYFAREPNGLERIDVIKGPASVLYGPAIPGGVVNKISKRPQSVTFAEIGAQYGNHDRHQAQFDLGGAIAGDGRYLARLTGLWRDSRGWVQVVAYAMWAPASAAMPTTRVTTTPTRRWMPALPTSGAACGSGSTPRTFSTRTT